MLTSPTDCETKRTEPKDEHDIVPKRMKDVLKDRVETELLGKNMHIEEVVADEVHTDAETRTQKEVQSLKETMVTENDKFDEEAANIKIMTARMRLWRKMQLRHKVVMKNRTVRKTMQWTQAAKRKSAN